MQSPVQKYLHISRNTPVLYVVHTILRATITTSISLIPSTIKVSHRQSPMKRLAVLRLVSPYRCLQEWGYNCCISNVKPILNQRPCQIHFNWAKEKKNWTVAHWAKVFSTDESKWGTLFKNQHPEVRREIWEALKNSTVNLLHSMMICGGLSSAGVGGG